MIWNIEDFIEIDLTCPGLLFGQYEIVCKACNCLFIVQEMDIESGVSECTNCGHLCDVIDN